MSINCFIITQPYSLIYILSMAAVEIQQHLNCYSTDLMACKAKTFSIQMLTEKVYWTPTPTRPVLTSCYIATIQWDHSSKLTLLPVSKQISCSTSHSTIKPSWLPNSWFLVHLLISAFALMALTSLLDHNSYLLLIIHQLPLIRWKRPLDPIQIWNPTPAS